MEGSLVDIGASCLPKSVTNHPFSCDKCTGSFTRKEHLLRHYRTHENVKPFECSICGQSFGRKDLRDRHERNLHRKVRPPASRKTKTATTGSSEAETSPKRLNTAIPKLEVQRLHLDLFFACFASCVPIIHQATFKASRRSPGLVRCMAAIGASYSTDPHVQTKSMTSFREEQIAMRQALSTASLDQHCLDLLIESLLISAFSLSQIESPGHEHARHLLHDSINLARRLGLSKALTSRAKSPPATLHQRWIEWIKYESFKRIGLLFMVVDSVSCCLHNSTSQLSFLEMKHNMPVDEMIWNARSAEEWQAACLSLSANSEMPLSDAMHLLLNSYRLPNTLNELSSILLSTCLLNSILELSAWKALYTLRTRHDNSISQQRFGNGPQYGPEINTREAQLRFSMNVLLERARSQRLTITAPSAMWEVTTTIQQFAYLRLHLPSAQTVHGIVSTDWPSMMRQTMYSIVSEDLLNINYRPTTLLLNYFIELILSQVHLQLQDSSGISCHHYLATESPVGCITLVQVMVDIWRLLRFTTLHGEQISSSSELSQARQAFLSTIRELTDSVGGSFLQGNIVQEDEVARSLTLVCTNMYHATRMSTFQVGADHFALLTRLINEPTVEVQPRNQDVTCDAWTMLSRCL